MRVPVGLLVACLALSSCSNGTTPPTARDDDEAATAAPSPSAAPEAAPSPEAEPLFPGPHADTPTTAAALAEEIRRTNARLPRIVRRWLDAGGPLPSSQPIPKEIPEEGRDLVYGALWQQRLYQTATRDPRLGSRALELLPDRMARVVADHTSAGRGLRSLVTPLKGPLEFKVTPPHDPHKLMRIYKDAQADYGVSWEYLAALNFVESKFGRFMGPSSAGAEGPMQFIPSTWDYYGNGGDVWDPRDAIRGAARYLVASGAPADWRGALFAYNRSYEYVDAVIAYARNIERDPRNFYVYYFWQVFVLTTKGDAQITGPGARRV